MTNNFEQIKELLDFSQEGTFYYIQLMRRKKDNPDAKSVKVIKDMYVDNLEYLETRMDSVIEMCDYFNARAYIRLNRRSYEDVTYQLNEDLAKAMKSRQYKHVSRLFSKACGRTNVEPNRIWVVDMDREDYPLTGNFFEKAVEATKDLIRNLQKEVRNKDYKLLADIPTPGGMHIITNPFNVKKYCDKTGASSDDIKKDNPTVLYCP